MSTAAWVPVRLIEPAEVKLTQPHFFLNSSLPVHLLLHLQCSFFQLRVKQEYQKLLAFIVPCAKFILKRAAMGEKNSGDALNIHSRVLLIGLSSSWKIFNDILLNILSITNLYNSGSRLLWKTVSSNWKFSHYKADCGSTVTFCGYQLTATPENEVLINPSEDNLDALLSSFPPQPSAGSSLYLGSLTHWQSGCLS